MLHESNRSETVYTADFGDAIFLQAVASGDQGPLLELTLDSGDSQITVRLDDYHVKELRLSLSRYERLRKEGTI